MLQIQQVDRLESRGYGESNNRENIDSSASIGTLRGFT